MVAVKTREKVQSKTAVTTGLPYLEPPERVLKVDNV